MSCQVTRNLLMISHNYEPVPIPRWRINILISINSAMFALTSRLLPRPLPRPSVEEGKCQDSYD